MSDTCFAKTNQDLSGPKLKECIQASFPDACIVATRIVPDEEEVIKSVLLEWSNGELMDVILTTGGTGFAKRDVTPEATKAVIDKEAPGLSYAIISKGMAVTDLAVLSRAVSGIKNKTLIINFPGSVKAASESFGFIKNVLPHAVAHVREDRELIKCEHRHIQGLSQSKVKVDQSAYRNRNSPYPKIEVNEALKMIFENLPSGLHTECIDISQSLHRILAEDVYAKEPMPPFNASIKDGYAVKTSDGAGIRQVRNVVAAGDAVDSDRPLDDGEIISISTGAPVPQGADAVVQIEDTTLVQASPDGSRELNVEINVAPKLYQDIRMVGSEILVNELVLNKGDTIFPGHIGVLATVGKVNIKVYKRAQIGLLSTGNELQAPHEELKPAHVRDSNKLALLNLLKQYSFEANDCGLAKDNPESVKKALHSALSKYDVVVTTGGVSMGEFDLIKEVLEMDFNATIHFGRVNMKPGKPATFATCNFDGKLKAIFGLPGNPVSAMVTTVLFVIPALRHLENNREKTHAMIPVVLGEEFTVDRRPEYVRVRLTSCDNVLKAYSVGNQISSKINSFVNANALMLVPSKLVHPNSFKKGDILNAIMLNQRS